MMRAFLLIVSLLCTSAVFAQESGNRIYSNRGYYNQTRRQPQTNTGNLWGNNAFGYSIEASVLTNLMPDSFVAVFGVNDEAVGAAASNQKVNTKVAELTKAIAPLGIGPDASSSTSLPKIAFTTTRLKEARPLNIRY
jgi:hypothetical protein